MKLVVDAREHDFIKNVREKLEFYPHIDLVVQQLDLGDLEIHYNDEKLLIWERKTFADLLHSIKDGRYSEQSHRLLNNYKNSQIVYLIEGIMSQLRLDEKKIVLSSMTTLAFFKNVHVWRTIHVNDSVDQVLSCCDKIYREYEKGHRFETSYSSPLDDSIPPSYSQFVKKEKKGNITPENIGEIFLCQIPGIKHNTAQAIMEKVGGDFSQVIHLTKHNPKELSTITIGKDKPRKISKTLVVALCNYLGGGGNGERSEPS